MKTVKQSEITLYFSPYCPYCHLVLESIQELGIVVNIELENAGKISLKDISTDKNAAIELRKGGGRSTVPCIKVDNKENSKWIYESMDIIDFLKEQVEI